MVIVNTLPAPAGICTLKNEYIYGGRITVMANSIDNSAWIHKHDIETLARCLFPEIQKYFSSEEGKREFEKWKAQNAQSGRDGK